MANNWGGEDTATFGGRVCAVAKLTEQVGFSAAVQVVGAAQQGDADHLRRISGTGLLDFSGNREVQQIAETGVFSPDSYKLFR